jgi:hypothetical protein
MLLPTVVRPSHHRHLSAVFRAAVVPLPRSLRTPRRGLTADGSSATRLRLDDESAALPQPVGHRDTCRAPCGDEDSPVLVTAAETALEPNCPLLSSEPVQTPQVTCWRPALSLLGKGDAGQSLFLLLDSLGSA